MYSYKLQAFLVNKMTPLINQSTTDPRAVMTIENGCLPVTGSAFAFTVTYPADDDVI